MVEVGAAATVETGMDLQDLRSFQALAEELSFTAAARRLHVSQPSLSKRLQRLERRLGATLFERTTSSVSLTPAGAWLFSRATGLLAEWQAVTDQAQVIAAGGRSGLCLERRTPLRVAVPGLGSGTFEPYLSAAMPAHDVTVSAMPVEEAMERLDAGEGVDAALVHDPPGRTAHPPVPGAHVATVVVEPVWVLVGARHPLAQRDELTVEEIAQYELPWIVGSTDALGRWHAAFVRERAPRAQLREPFPSSQVDVARGRAVAFECPLSPPNELIASRPLTPTMTTHIYLTWQPHRLPVGAELLTAARGFYRETAQRHPRYWRWIRDHPGHYPGIGPDLPRGGAEPLAEPAGA